MSHATREPGAEAAAGRDASTPAGDAPREPDDFRVEIQGDGRPAPDGATVLRRLRPTTVPDAPERLESVASPVVAGASLDVWRRQGRAALGLPVDGPLVMSGHQPGPWHGGIVAKYALLRALADGAGVSTADVLVEQDATAPLSMEVPAQDVVTGRIRARVIEWAGTPADRAAGFQPPAAIRTAAAAGLESAEILPVGAVERLRAYGQRLATSSARTLAAQVREAVAASLPASVRPPAAITTGDVLGTDFGRALVMAMVDDPWACAHAYNAAVRATNRAGGPRLTELQVRDDFVELPLWRIDDRGARRRADDVDAAAWLDGASADAIRPRALLLTAIVRLGLADVFVHGTGGGAYDVAMERWVERWLGVTVPPCVVCSADLRLAWTEWAPSAAERDGLVAAAHRVWHDPEADDLDGRRLVPEPSARRGASDARPETPRPGPVKQELLDEINRRPRGSRARRAAYRLMHDQLESLRGVHVGRVETAERRARAAGLAHANAAVMGRRDWPAIVHPTAALEGLALAAQARVRTE